VVISKKENNRGFYGLLGWLFSFDVPKTASVDFLGPRSRA
jgi:hypothetical protein